MVWDFGTVVLWLEINEHQHEAYDPACEKSRRMEIWEDLGCRPTVLVEFNPDEYTERDGSTVPGMFREKRLSTGDKRLHPVQDEFERRMDVLIDTLRSAMTCAFSESGPDWDGVAQVFLFYTPATQERFSCTTVPS